MSSSWSIAERLRLVVADAPPAATIGILGHTSECYIAVSEIRSLGLGERLIGVYAASLSIEGSGMSPNLKPLARLEVDRPNIVIVAADRQKEDLLGGALPYLQPETQIVLAGYSHFEFRDEAFEHITANPLVPSLANGYPNTLIHIYQCLRNAARLNCDGVVAEFGMFKGGTTMLMSRFIERLGKDWKVFGFDTFDGFPPRRSVLDMYEHAGCVFTDLASVQRYLAGRNVEVVAGDVIKTAIRLSKEQLVLAFIDTDNYTSATAVLDVIQDRVVVGGAIVFDHFTGRERFLYTLGERMAGKRLLDDVRYFNLHDTGVFIRMR